VRAAFEAATILAERYYRPLRTTAHVQPLQGGRWPRLALGASAGTPEEVTAGVGGGAGRRRRWRG
jgi:hypothetical protein